MPRAVGTRSTSARRRIGCALVVALAAIGLAACGDAGRRDAAPAGSATPGAPAVPPKLAIVYTPQLRDGSVLCDGEWLLLDRRITRVDEAAVLAEAADRAAAVRRRAGLAIS
jgi:hypothetical protein